MRSEPTVLWLPFHLVAENVHQVAQYEHGVMGIPSEGSAKLITHLNHQQAPGEDKTPHKCHYCSKRFATVGARKRHELIHSDERPHKCQFCRKGFNQKVHLRVHERTHTGEKPYKCSVCNKGFAQSNNCTTHMLVHHSQNKFMY